MTISYPSFGLLSLHRIFPYFLTEIQQVTRDDTDCDKLYTVLIKTPGGINPDVFFTFLNLVNCSAVVDVHSVFLAAVVNLAFFSLADVGAAFCALNT